MELGLACLIVMNVMSGQKASFPEHQKMQEAVKLALNGKCEKEAKKYADEMKEKAEKLAKEKEGKK